jgi:hypothetical protein
MTGLVTLGLRTRVEGMQRTITASAGGLASTAGTVTDKGLLLYVSVQSRLGC